MPRRHKSASSTFTDTRALMPALPWQSAFLMRRCGGGIACVRRGSGAPMTPATQAHRCASSLSSSTPPPGEAVQASPASVQSARDHATDGGPAVAHTTPAADDADAAVQRQQARDAIIQEILSRDKVVFELKRQHELSMLRVEQNQGRVLKDQEDRGMYYEQNSNVHTFDTVSVGLYSQRSTLYHTLSAERLRNVKVLLMVLSTLATCVYLYYRYMINPEWTYVERPMNLLGSRVMAVRELRWKLLSEAEQRSKLRNEDSSAA